MKVASQAHAHEWEIYQNIPPFMSLERTGFLFRALEETLIQHNIEYELSKNFSSEAIEIS